MVSAVVSVVSVAVSAVASRDLILGGQKSGKSRRAEQLASQWLLASPTHRAVLIATAQAGNDAEMAQRIARHRCDRALRVPALQTVEEPLALAAAIECQALPGTLVVVDCLPLWLSNCMFPRLPLETHVASSDSVAVAIQQLLAAVDAVSGRGARLVLVSNEIGLGVIPLGVEVRAFVDALGLLHQELAARCERVTLMVAGLPVAVKGPSL